MKKLPKYVFIKILEIFEEKGCKNIEDMKNLINNDLKKDTDIVFSWR